MPRSVLVYLADVTGACEAIARFLAGADYAAYRDAELTRSAVERQLIVIGEAVNALLRLEPSLADSHLATLAASSTSATSSRTTTPP